MSTQLYSLLLRIAGLFAAIFSGISAALLWSAPPPSGFRNIDPLALRTSMVAVLLILGVVATLIAAFIIPATKWLLLKTVIFAAAGFSNAAALGSGITVPLQGTTSLIALVCALGLAVVTLVMFVDSVQKKNPGSKF